MLKGRAYFLTSLAALGLILSGAWARGEATARAIRFVVPNAPVAVPGERDLSNLVDEYNQSHRGPGAPLIQLVRRGDNFSSLKELIALYLAGEPPEIAAIECSELPALGRTLLAKPIPKSLAGAQPNSLPFEHSVPVLVADQEMLYRIHADHDRLPRTWEDLVKLAARIVEAVPGSPPLALPLQGPRGLWIFEALAGKPLWIREAGGLKTNRDLERAIQSIQSLLSPRAPELAASEMTWDRGLQDFLDRKAPLLVTTLDALPLIAHKASFRWKSGPLPTLGHATPLLMTSGADLIVTRDDPEVWKFLQYLYSKEISARWVPSGGFIPLKSEWQTTASWKQAPDSYRELAKTAAGAVGPTRIARSTDSDVVRAHTEWISALHYLFGETAKRLPTETVFTQLDSTLAP